MLNRCGHWDVNTCVRTCSLSWVEQLRDPFFTTVPNFVKIGQTVAEITRFCDFQHSGRRHLAFSKVRNFNGRCAGKGQCASPCQISSKSVKWRFNCFQNCGCPPSWIRWSPIGITRDDHFVVSIVVQNLVKIDAVVSITWNFQYFARLAWKRLFAPQNWGFRGLHPQNEKQYQLNSQKAHPCMSPRRLSYQAWKYVDGSDL